MFSDSFAMSRLASFLVIIAVWAVTYLTNDLPFLPYLFCIRAPVTYLKRIDELPPDARYFLITPNHQQKIRRIRRFARARPLVWTPKYPPTFRGGESVLFVVDG